MADLKASLCGELPNQESVIPKEQLRNLLERRGIVGDPDIPNAKARLAEQELRRNMYHNTQVMLKHYRDIVWALECFPSEVAQELDQPLKDLDALLSGGYAGSAGECEIGAPSAQYPEVPAPT